MCGIFSHLVFISSPKLCYSYKVSKQGTKMGKTLGWIPKLSMETYFFLQTNGLPTYGLC